MKRDGQVFIYSRAQTTTRLVRPMLQDEESTQIHLTYHSTTTVDSAVLSLDYMPLCQTGGPEKKALLKASYNCLELQSVHFSTVTPASTVWKQLDQHSESLNVHVHSPLS